MPRKTYRFFGTYRRQADLNTVQPIQSADENTEDDYSDHDEISDEIMSLDQHERASSDIEMENVDERSEGGSDLGKLLKTTSTQVLCFLTSACISRFSERDFNRFLSCHSPLFRDEARALWNFKKGQYSVMHFCNLCGNATNSIENCVCGGVVQKVVRVGAFPQLIDLVKHHLPNILKLREKLKSGENRTHNLNAEFLRHSWQNETGEILNLSLFASVDGVSLKGNSKKKIWPITLKLADLPISEMQKSTNILLEAIIEGKNNPSTTLWNEVLPILYMDIEGKIGEVGGIKFKASIVSFTADQPAKRSLFGMAASNSELSCFYGLCTGTLHKTRGPERYTQRKGILTQEDGKNGANGFKDVPPYVLEKVMPYDTIVDILHNFPEGILDVILTELGSTRKSKSTLFADPNRSTPKAIEKIRCHPFYKKMERRRNATEKMNYFRIQVGLSAFENRELSSKGRLVIIALMLLCNYMYSDCTIGTGFVYHLTDIAKRILIEASNNYMSIKCHEALEHLPYVFWKFGNPAPLSTFSYESFYKFCLSGFNPQLTTNFTETAATRVQLHVSLRREITRRATEDPSIELEDFLKLTPDLRPFEQYWSHKLSCLTAEELQESDGQDVFGKLNLSYGALLSKYSKATTSSDLFFAADENNNYTCHRFICVTVNNGKALSIITEPVIALPRPLQFDGLQKIEQEMKGTALETTTSHLLSHARVYKGLVHGTLSGRRALIPLNTLKGFAAQFNASNGAYFLQINGTPVHN